MSGNHWKRSGKGRPASETQVRKFHELRKEGRSPAEAARALGRSRSWGYERDKRGPGEVDGTPQTWQESRAQEYRDERDAVALLMAFERGDWMALRRYWSQHEHHLKNFAGHISGLAVKLAKQIAAQSGAAPADVLADLDATVKREQAEEIAREP